MFALHSMPSTTSVLSTYSAFAASAMLLKTVLNEIQSLTSQILPLKLQEKIFSILAARFGSDSSQLTLVMDECKSFSTNEFYRAAEAYLTTLINPSIKQLKVYKDEREKNPSVTVDIGQKIIDTFQGIQLVWEFTSSETPKTVIDIESFSQSSEKSVHRSVMLSFNKQHKEMVLDTYLPYVLERSKVLQNEKRDVKLYALGGYNNNMNLDHPSTFETMAMDPGLKKELIDDLDRFVKRKDFYRRVGKPWKRGYLLYGPPGTGKSSLIAAMANYLKFDIYDLELTTLRSNSDLKTWLTGTTNRSILVIEDIDCSIELQDRQTAGYNDTNNQLTLSGLLNFIDGLWSSCGDERIIVFTTNYKDRLDPALLRPGRMDMHIHMSYCTPCGFKILASNYLQVKEHFQFEEIEELIKEVEVTPAEVAEELMKSEDVDVALQGLIAFLQSKKQSKCETIVVEDTEERKDVEEEGDEVNQEMEQDCVKKRRKVQKNKRRKSKR